jgi:hypothetical protein
VGSMKKIKKEKKIFSMSASVPNDEEAVYLKMTHKVPQGAGMFCLVQVIGRFAAGGDESEDLCEIRFISDTFRQISGLPETMLCFSQKLYRINDYIHLPASGKKFVSQLNCSLVGICECRRVCLGPERYVRSLISLTGRVRNGCLVKIRRRDRQDFDLCPCDYPVDVRKVPNVCDMCPDKGKSGGTKEKIKK